MTHPINLGTSGETRSVQKVREHRDVEGQRTHSAKDERYIEVVTLGCRLNTYESEVMREHARAQGIEKAVIINTCAVTNEAERQSRQAVRKARRTHPDAKIIVTGCSAQIHPDIYATMPEVDRVLGNHEKMQRDNFAIELPQKVVVTDIMAVKETAHHLIMGFENRARAFIEIQNGCDHRCTFCSIPFGRGNNRSVPVAEIVRQVSTLVEEGCQEVVLTGVDITGYGSDLPAQPRLGQMMRRLLSHVPGLPRLRLSSLDPVEMDEDLYDLMMPHFHLSLQAGDNMILKRMKRRHLREDAIAVVERIKTLRPDAVFGADIIAGFPTETEDMFQNSLDIVDRCDLTFLHVFPYSPRQGTPAARMPQVKRADIKVRAEQLRQKGADRLRVFLQNQVGRTAAVLVERDLKGRTEHFAQVVFEDEESIKPFAGKTVKAMITGVQNELLTARLVI
jgi:threonylcarbamoyladenosine tRNA methylthiotransferase MtaB